MTAYMDHKDLTNTAIANERAQEIADNVHRVLDRVNRAQEASGRTDHVNVLAATKTRDVAEIMAAIDAGIRMIGENRPQEVVAKIDGLRAAMTERSMQFVSGATHADEHAEAVEIADDIADIELVPFHLIGQLQPNKINKVLGNVDTIQSVDSLALAQKIASRAISHGTPVSVMLEVNESHEPTKSGCASDEAEDLAYEIAALDGIDLAGFMTIGAHVDDECKIHDSFAALRTVRDHVMASHVAGTEHAQALSMGMSGDFDIAIQEGATVIRVGSAIFGEREFI